jgi:hypothetical protein
LDQERLQLYLPELRSGFSLEGSKWQQWCYQKIRTQVR